MASERDPLVGIPDRDGEWRRYGRWWWHPPTGVLVPVIAGGTSAPSYTQTRARWRNDDGSEAAATWRTIEGAGVSLPIDSVPLDTNIRLRIQVDETGGVAGTISPRLRYALNGGAYTVVDAASSVARSSASPNVADGVATTAQLTAPAGNFRAGSIDEVDGACADVVFLAGEYTELEWCIQIRSADVAVGDTIDFRCYNDTATLNTYTATPRAVRGVAVRVARSISTANPTTTGTAVIDAATRTDDDLYAVFTSRDHTSGDADATVTDDDTGGNTWTQVGQSSDKKANVFWKKATSGTASKTLTFAGAIGSLSGGCLVVMGAASGDPTTNMLFESNASADETMAGFTPTNANSLVVFSVHNYGNDNAVTAPSCATLGALTEHFDNLSTGGTDCACNASSKVSAGGPSATGDFTWAQANGATWSAQWAVKPSGSTLLTLGAPVLTFSAPTATLSTPVTLTLSAPTVVFSAPTATLQVAGDQTLSLGAPVLTLSAPTTTIDAPVTLALGAPVLVFSAPSTTLDTPATLALSAPVLTFSAPTATLDSPVTLAAGAPVLVFSAPATTLLAETTLVLTAPTITLSAPAATLDTPATLALSAPVLTFSAPTATLLVAGGGGTTDDGRTRFEGFRTQSGPQLESW